MAFFFLAKGLLFCFLVIHSREHPHTERVRQNALVDIEAFVKRWSKKHSKVSFPFPPVARKITPSQSIAVCQNDYVIIRIRIAAVRCAFELLFILDSDQTDDHGEVSHVLPGLVCDHYGMAQSQLIFDE